MKRSNVLVLAGLLASPAPTTVLADDRPAWRGPRGAGISAETDLPLRWGEKEGVRWRAELPDRGNSSPIVWGDRVFITQAIPKEGRRTVIGFDRATGRELWRSGVVYQDKEQTQEANGFCSASPVTDGERIIASFGSAGIYCYDFRGNELWHRDLGKLSHPFGNASSPVLHGDLCLLYVGPDEKDHLIALDKRTGGTIWRVDPPRPDEAERKASSSGEPPPGPPGGERRPLPPGAWTCPIVIEVAGRSELIMSFPYRVVALDPSSGKELWSCKGLTGFTYASPVSAGDLIVASGGEPGNCVMVAVRAGGEGDVTGSRRLWRVPRAKGRFGSPVIRDGFLYSISQMGIAECRDLTTGEIRWEERLAGAGEKGESWSSMLLAGDRIYVPNKSGDVFVLKASPAFGLLATCSLGEPMNSSPAASRGELFFRTDRALWCIGKQAPAAPAAEARPPRPAPVRSPEVLADRRVTFRINAPKATEVVVNGQWPGGRAVMARDAYGVWTSTSGPIEPGVWEYGFVLDGVAMVDPGNPAIKPMREPRTSILHLPGSPPGIHDFQDVPHGTVHRHTYVSKSLGRPREMAVYTPPGYDRQPPASFPALYLQHGSGDNQDTWTVHGKAHWILDNLNADGRAASMVVVMLDGHAALPGDGGDNTALFERDLLDDAMPFVEARYRLRPDAGGRAIVGLSMGGGQALRIGLNHLDRFAGLGGFSSSAPSRESLAGFLADPAAAEGKLKLLWIGCGRGDFLLRRNEEFVGLLREKGIRHEWRLTDGDHSWPIWRGYLAELAPKLFRNTANF